MMRLISPSPRAASVGSTTPRSASRAARRSRALFARRFRHRAPEGRVRLMDDNLAPPGARLKPREIARRVLAWWDVHRRDLPWRARPGERRDPYRVWLSEILLQQTSATAAAPYFLKFVARWPNVEALAAASLDEVIAAFSGLGYYSRARNLHACAQEVGAARRAIPARRSGVARAARRRRRHRRRGRGDRLRREDGAGRRQRRAHAGAASRPGGADRASAATDRRSGGGADAGGAPGDFAEALMDLGALICRPRRPDCPACPLRGLRGGGARRARGLSSPRRRQAQAGPGRRGVLRPARGRRDPGAAAPARGAAGRDARIAGRAVARRPSARTRARPGAPSRRLGGACRAKSSRPSPTSPCA